MADEKRTDFDTIVVGSGFGGAMAAHPLVAAGQRVLMLERGDWVRMGGHSSDPVRGFFQLTPAYSADPGYATGSGRRQSREGICACVGGPSVFYGGASFRFRVDDFAPGPEIVGDSGARWPFDYAESHGVQLMPLFDRLALPPGGITPQTSVARGSTLAFTDTVEHGGERFLRTWDGALLPANALEVARIAEESERRQIQRFAEMLGGAP